MSVYITFKLPRSVADGPLGEGEDEHLQAEKNHHPWMFSSCGSGGVLLPTNSKALPLPQGNPYKGQGLYQF